MSYQNRKILQEMDQLQVRTTMFSVLFMLSMLTLAASFSTPRDGTEQVIGIDLGTTYSWWDTYRK